MLPEYFAVLLLDELTLGTEYLTNDMDELGTGTSLS